MTEVELPDGTVLEFPDGMSQDEIKSVMRKKFPQETVLATTPDGGRIVERNGVRSFTSPAYSTNDPAQIDRIMEGATPAEVSTSGFDQQTLSQTPRGVGTAIKAVEGVPFVGSYVDEAAGAMFGPDAQQGVRAVSGAMERESPGTSLGAGLAGTVAGSVPLAYAAAPRIAARAATSLGGRALQAMGLGAAAGATEGAVYGAGEGTDNRGAKAAEGGAFGGLVGGVLGAAAPYAAEGVKRALTALRGSDTSIISSTLGVSGPAARVIKSALDRGDMNEALTALQRAGDDAVLADAGQPARELLDAAANSGGQAGAIARRGVERRVDKASADIQNTLDSVFGTPKGVNTSRREIRESTAGARDATYEAAYSQPIDYSSGRGRALEALMRRVPESAIRKANALMRLNDESSAQILAEVGEDGTVKFTRMPDVRQLDYITRALNDVADAADGQGKLGGQTAEGRATRNLSTQIRGTLRRAVPEYGDALDTAADAISRSKAIETGSRLLRAGTTREAVTDALRGSTRAERDAMKQGVRDGIDDMLANVQAVISDPNQDAREALKLLRTVSSRANMTKLTALLGNRQAAQLAAELDKAATAFELRAAIAQNSKTAIRQAIQGSVEGQTAPGVLETLSAGEPANASKRFVQLFTGATDEAQALRQMGIYEDIARALTQIEGVQANRALITVQQAMRGQKISEEAAARVGRVLATTGVLAGNREGTRQLTTQ